MTPLEELEAAELNGDQDNYLIGALASLLDLHGVIDRETWTGAIQQAKAQVWS